MSLLPQPFLRARHYNPFIQHNKDSVDLTPAEISARDDLRIRARRKTEAADAEDRADSNDRIDLERRVEAALTEFDARLADLYRLKIRVEKCVLTEEMKILLLDRNLADMEALGAKQEEMMQVQDFFSPCT